VWWKALLYGCAIILAGLYLVPTGGARGEASGFLQRALHQAHPAWPGLAGWPATSLRGEYRKAVSGKVDRLSNDIEDAIKKKTPDVTVGREGRDDIVISFKNPAGLAGVGRGTAQTLRRELDEISRDAAAGTLRLRYDPDRVVEVEELALRQAIETIRGRVDKFGVAEPTIIKKGTDIVVELPGLKTVRFRAHQEASSAAPPSLSSRIVDDGTEYMKKLGASLPKEGPIKAEPETWTEKHSGQQHEDVYLRTRTVPGWRSSSPPCRAIWRCPRIASWRLRRFSPRESGEAAPEKFYRTYLLKKRAVGDRRVFAMADATWDEMGRPEVSFTMNRQGSDMMEKLTGEMWAARWPSCSTTRSPARRSSSPRLASAAD